MALLSFLSGANWFHRPVNSFWIRDWVYVSTLFDFDFLSQILKPFQITKVFSFYFNTAFGQNVLGFEKDFLIIDLIQITQSFFLKSIFLFYLLYLLSWRCSIPLVDRGSPRRHLLEFLGIINGQLYTLILFLFTNVLRLCCDLVKFH